MFNDKNSLIYLSFYIHIKGGLHFYISLAFYLTVISYKSTEEEILCSYNYKHMHG